MFQSAPWDVEQWEHPSKVQEFVGSALFAGRLLPVIGAGVSYFSNLPSWTSLLLSLAEEVGISEEESSTKISKLGPFEFATHVREVGYNNEQSVFLKALHQHLYKENSVSALHETFQNSGMHALNFICSRSIRGGARNVITYNYDDILERMFRFGGFVAESIDKPAYVNSHCDVRIFHPNGFLPIELSDPGSARAVICSDDLTSDEYKKWDQLVVEKYSRNFVLLIGLSGYDTKLIEQLEIARKNHPLINHEKQKYFGVALCYGDCDASALQSAGVKVLKFTSPEEWPGFVFEVCRFASELAK